MNDEKCVNTFKKGRSGWSLTITTGRVFPCTCEQKVAHLLPALAFESRMGITVKVIPDEEN